MNVAHDSLSLSQVQEGRIGQPPSAKCFSQKNLEKYQRWVHLSDWQWSNVVVRLRACSGMNHCLLSQAGSLDYSPG